MANINELMNQITNDQKVCSLPWGHLFVDPTGRIKPCCRFFEPKSTKSLRNSLSTHFNSENMQKIRHDMLAGVPVRGCQRCFEEESSGKRSLRQRYNDDPLLGLASTQLDRPEVKWLELALANDCNMACRMCDSRYSQKWYDEELALWGKTMAQSKVQRLNVEELTPFLASLKHVKLTGGEPLLAPSHMELLRKLISSGRAQEIFLNYSTNMSVFPSSAVIEMWKEFNFVEVALSADAASPAEWEYIRYPQKYEKMLKTVEKFLALQEVFQGRLKLILRPTVSIYNVWVFPEVYLWWQQFGNFIFNPTHLTFPQFLSITALPDKFKHRVEKRLREFFSEDLPPELSQACEYMVHYMWQADHSSQHRAFVEYTRRLDKRRNQDFKKALHYLSDLLDI